MRRSLIASFVVSSLLLLGGCASSPQSTTPEDGTSPPSTACSYAAGGTAARAVDAPPSEPVSSGEVAATIRTSAGDIPVTLDAGTARCTVGSFVSLAQQGYFDETSCHRLTTSGIFVLQCGDPTATGRGGPGYSFPDELSGSETYPAGTVAMANAGPNTNGSQFFLVYEDTQLPPAYTVFGQMDAAGLAVVKEIAATGAAGGAPDGAPATPVTILGVTTG